jgi:hypothetical protein
VLDDGRRGKLELSSKSMRAHCVLRCAMWKD